MIPDPRTPDRLVSYVDQSEARAVKADKCLFLDLRPVARPAPGPVPIADLISNPQTRDGRADAAVEGGRVERETLTPSGDGAAPAEVGNSHSPANGRARLRVRTRPRRRAQAPPARRVAAGVETTAVQSNETQPVVANAPQRPSSDFDVAITYCLTYRHVGGRRSTPHPRLDRRIPTSSPPARPVRRSAMTTCTSTRPPTSCPCLPQPSPSWWAQFGSFCPPIIKWFPMVHFIFLSFLILFPSERTIIRIITFLFS